MSALGDAVKGIKQLLLLQEQVERLERGGAKQSDALEKLAGELIGIDKRVVRIETLIEVASSRGVQPPRLEG